MDYKLVDLIDISLIKSLQEKLNSICSFPSSIIDNEGNVLTAVAHQDICTLFHKRNPDSVKECIKSDKYILEHLNEANPSLCYKCPHGLIDSATPIVIDGNHFGIYFTGQFFLDQPDYEFFRHQAKKYGFNEKSYLEAVAKVPVWTMEKLIVYQDFIKEFVELIAGLGLKNLKEIKTRQLLEENQKDIIKSREESEESRQQFKEFFDKAADAIFIAEMSSGILLAANQAASELMMLPVNAISGLHQSRLHPPENELVSKELFDTRLAEIEKNISLKPDEHIILRSDGKRIPVEILASKVLFEGKDCVMGTFRDITTRKRKEEELRNTTETLKFHLENTPLAFIEFNNENRIIEWSEKATRMFGWTAEEVIGKNYEELHMVHEEDAADVSALIAEMNSENKGSNTHINKNYRKDGSVIVCEWNNSVLTDSEGNLVSIHCLIHDITARVQSDARNRMMNLSMDVFSDGIYWMNSDNIFVYVNEAGGRAFGCKPEELLGKSLYDVNPTTTPESLDDLWFKLRTLGSYTAETVHRRLDGSEFFVEVRSVYVKYDGKEFNNGYARDITERKNKEKEIRKLQKAIESSKASVVITDHEGRIEYSNQYFTELTGYSPEESRGENPKFLNSGFHPVEYYKSLWNTILSGKTWEGEFQNKKKNGEIYWEHAIISPLTDDSGAITHFVAIKTDITEMKQINSELVLAKEKAEESDRLKTAFLQNMSHEIRTPLNGIVGFAQLLAELNKTDLKNTAYSQMISRSSDKLIGIITDVIEISQIHANQVAVELSEIDIVSFVNNIVDVHKEAAKDKNIDLLLYLDVHSEVSLIRSDVKKLEKILTHLIDNAIKFTTQGTVKISCDTSHENLLITVADTGIGIPAEIQSVIFKPFRQAEINTNRNYGGNGLGLALVKAYTELLGGTITMRSEFSKGSVFTISLPLKMASPFKVFQDKQNGFSAKPEETSPSMKTILIAEDEKINFIYLNEILSSSELKILHAVNGQEAVDMCHANAEISLILMDIKMPVMDGVIASRIIKEFRPDLPIIAQTAYALESEKNSYSEVFNDYLTKPIKKDVLKQKLSVYINVSGKR